jgi:hypothetical protein
MSVDGGRSANRMRRCNTARHGVAPSTCRLHTKLPTIVIITFLCDLTGPFENAYIKKFILVFSVL